MKVLIIRKVDIEKAVSYSDVMKAVEEGFKALHNGLYIMPLRTIININNNYALYMPAYIGSPKSLAVKIVTVYPGNVSKNLPTISALVVYNDPETGLPKAVIEGGYVTVLRTSATSVLSAKYLAREESETLTIIGAGQQGRGHLNAFSEIMNIKKVYIYDRIIDKSKELAEEAQSHGINALVVDDIRKCIEKSDIVVLATTATKPVVNGDWFRPGTHIVSIGWMGKDARELDTKTVLKSKLVVDLKEAVLAESGDILIPISEGAMTANHIYAELSEIVSGIKPGRENDQEITLFKSVGLAMEDTVTARIIYEKVKEKNLGIEIEL